MAAAAAPVPDPAPPHERPTPPTEPSPAPRSFHVWLTPVASFGAAPATSLGGPGGHRGPVRGIVSLGVEGRADLPASASALGGARVSTNLVLGSLAACLRAPSPLFVCGLAAIGSFHESGSNLERAQSENAFFAALGARLGIALPLTRTFFFLAHADALSPLTRHIVQVDGQNVFEVSPVMGSFGIGAGATF